MRRISHLRCTTTAATSFARRSFYHATPIALQQVAPNPTAATMQSNKEAFERYTEIDNASDSRIRTLKSRQTLEALGGKDDWIATEKVHGANFGVYVLDRCKTFKYAKRSGIMPDSENFFGYQCLIPGMVKHATTIYQQIEKKFVSSPHTVIINGELFGGKYEHPLVPKSTQTYKFRGVERNIKAVQSDKFPQYSPNLHFYAFDIKYKATADSPLISLTFDEAVDIFERVGDDFLFARPIIRGPIEKVIAFDVENFITTIPGILGLGEFVMRNNISEGLVVRHVDRGTPGWEPQVATMFKYKCVAFLEKSDKAKGGRIDPMSSLREAAIKSHGPQLPARPSVFWSPKEQDQADDLLANICDTRLTNVVSKVGTDPFLNGEITREKLAMMLAQDSLKDYLKDADPAHVNIPYYQRQEMVRHLIAEAKVLVKDKWRTIVDEQKELEREE